MSKECGISGAAAALNSAIDGAKAKADAITGDITSGIASLASDIASQTDGIKADLESMVPDIPKPAADLQSMMQNLVDNPNPATMAQQLAEIEEKFGPHVDVSAMLDDFGLDSKELTDMSSKFKAADLLNVPVDLSGVGSLVGGAVDKIFGSLSATDAQSKVCIGIPKLEIDANGNVTEKGKESKAATEDAAADQDVAEKKADIKPDTKDVSADNVLKLIDPESKVDAEKFDFGTPINNKLTEELKKEFVIDTAKLAAHDKTLREVNSSYISRMTIRQGVSGIGRLVASLPGLPGLVTTSTFSASRNRDPDTEHYLACYREFLNLYKIQIQKKYQNLETDDKTSTFKVGELELSQTTTDDPGNYKYTNFKTFFVDNVPKNSTNRHKALIVELKTFDRITILEGE